MKLLGLSAVLSFLLALVLGASAVLAPAAALHIVFAIGILPLIFGAMLHFVPVLTRTGSPLPRIAVLPFVAQANGVLIVLAIQGWLPRGLLHLAAGIDLLVAVLLIGWMVGRSRRTLGSPHPGWRWYAASLSLLVLALTAVPMMLIGWAAAAPRLFHLHANIFGFIGLAALGTMPVLLPTALGKADPQAAPWLRRRLPVALAGVLLLALGAASWWPLSLAGAAVLGVLALGLLAHWWRAFGIGTLLADGVGASLAGALAGYALLLFAGGLHAARAEAAVGIVVAFVVAFLLPLVTGALAQLLPVWRFVGPNTPARQEMRRRLARFGRLRAAAFLAAGGSFLADAAELVLPLAALGLLLFVADLVFALRVPSPAR